MRKPLPNAVSCPDESEMTIRTTASLLRFTTSETVSCVAEYGARTVKRKPKITAFRSGRIDIPLAHSKSNQSLVYVKGLPSQNDAELRSAWTGEGARPYTNKTYTGTGTLSTISRSTCSACSDFFRVEV